jgi:hypothetical protein
MMSWKTFPFVLRGRCFRKYLLCVATVFALWRPIGAEITAANEREITTAPGETVLLLGEPTVARTSNLSQKYFPAQRHPANPIIKRTEQWEGVGPYIWGSRLMQDATSGQLRLWYIAYDYNGNFYRWGYATSKDAIHWTKPNLGLEKYRGAPASNCLSLGTHPEKGALSIARDPRPDMPPERRYLGIRFTYDGEFISFSADGIAWTEYASNPVWRVPSDIIHLMWDDRRQKFVAFYKIWEVTGRKVNTDDQAGDPPYTAFMPSFNTKKLDNGTTQFEGPCITFRPPGAAEVRSCTFALRSQRQGSDDGGGSSLSGDWTGKRVQAFAESADGIHWTNEQLILSADDKDPPTANIQYLFVVPYGGYYLGFATLHDERGQFRIQFAWSADGVQWQRPSRAPWLDIGQQGSFDSGMVLGPTDPILWQREMWFPYGGFPIHHDTNKTDWEAAVGLATMRLDGFAAWEAGNQTGELVTQPLRCNGDRLFVNADARNGSVAVEVLNGKGDVIDGFDAASCQPLASDTIEQQDSGWIHWKTKSELRDLQGKQLQLRFTLRNARLYSFRIADEKTMNLPVPRATDR